MEQSVTDIRGRRGRSATGCSPELDTVVDVVTKGDQRFERGPLNRFDNLGDGVEDTGGCRMAEDVEVVCYGPRLGLHEAIEKCSR